MQTYHEMSGRQRAAAARIVNAILANEMVLAVRTRKFHWNVSGAGFPALHALFAQQYREIDAIADDVAERVRALGEPALGTMAEFLEEARLEEVPGPGPEAREMLLILLADHEALAGELREDAAEIENELGDRPTADFLTSLVIRHEKLAWMLRATIGE